MVFWSSVSKPSSRWLEGLGSMPNQGRPVFEQVQILSRWRS